MKWYLNGACISTENSKNNEKFDTIADDMIFCFEKFEIISIVKINPYICDSNHKIIKHGEKEIINKRKYNGVIDTLTDGGQIAYGGYENTNYIFELFNCENDFFSITIKFKKVAAEWEYTQHKAWYVRD